MVIGDFTHVTLSYTLRVDSFEGRIIETVSESKPLTFVFGDGSLLENFENKSKGLSPNDNFDFSLTPDQAYGYTDENAIISIPLNAFEVNGSVDYEMVKLGNYVPMRDEQGNKLNGLVLEINDETVKMDFNHPLAGEMLFFKGTINQVRQVKEEDYENNHSCSCGGGCDC